MSDCNCKADEILTYDTLMDTWVISCEQCHRFIGFDDEGRELAEKTY